MFAPTAAASVISKTSFPVVIGARRTISSSMVVPGRGWQFPQLVAQPLRMGGGGGPTVSSSCSSFSTSANEQQQVSNNANRHGLIKRLASATPGGRVTLAGIFLVAGGILDYELYTWYYYSGSGKEGEGR